jgi:hypothetical protein
MEWSTAFRRLSRHSSIYFVLIASNCSVNGAKLGLCRTAGDRSAISPFSKYSSDPHRSLRMMNSRSTPAQLSPSLIWTSLCTSAQACSGVRLCVNGASPRNTCTLHSIATPRNSAVYLLDEATFPRDVVLHIGISALSGTLDASLFPKSSRTKTGIHRHRFTIPGMYFTMLAGSKITDKERFLCAAQSSGRHISIWQQTDQRIPGGKCKKILRTMKR